MVRLYSVIVGPHLSVSFDKYPEDNAAALYGLPGTDVLGREFPDFEYTSDKA